MRERQPTLPDAMSESHQEIDGGIRLLSLTAQQEHDLEMMLAKWAEGSFEERLTATERRTAHVLGEQIRSNTRVSRLEAWRGNKDRSDEEREARAMQLHEATMARFDEAVKARRKSTHAQIAILITAIAAALGTLATSAVLIVNAVRGTPQQIAPVEHGGK